MRTFQTTCRMLILVVLLALACSPILQAQSVTVTLTVSPRPSPYLSEWASRKETAILTITVPPGSAPIQAQLKASVSRDGTVQAATNLHKMPIITLQPGVNVYYAEHMIPFAAVDFKGDSYNTAVRTGMLPAGTYEYCVDIIGSPSGQSLIAEPICRGFLLTTYEPATLLQPEDKSALTDNDRPMFRWTPVIPTPPGGVEYRVMVFEVLDGQRTMQAFRSNRPILDRSVRNTTQLLWPVEFQLPTRVNEYVWTVRALDEKGKPIGENDGYAQPFSFTRASGGRQRTSGLPELEIAGKQQGGGIKQPGGFKTPGDSKQPQDISSGEKVGPGGGGQAVDTTNHGAGNAQVPPSGCQPAQTVPPAVVDQNPAGKQAAAYKDSVVTVGFFSMKVLTATGNSGALNGTGSIVVSWLRTPIAVQFTGIKINAANQVYDGDIVAQITATPDPYQTQWATNVVGGLPWTKDRIKSLDTWLKSNFSKQTKNFDLQQQIANYTDAPLQLPLGITDIKDYQIAIAEMKFTATGAQLAAVMALPILEENDILGFKVGNLFFTTSGPSFQAGTFALLEDVTYTGGADTWSMIFKKPTAPGTGTFIDWDCDGFRQAQVDIDFMLPRTWVVPSPDNNQNVKANVKTWVSDFNDWIINANLQKCTIVGTNGIDLEVTNMAFDHSDLRNPTGITFPKGMTGDTSLAFHGFYVKQAKLLLPDKLSSYDDPSKRITIMVNNMIINKTGLTCGIDVANILNYPKANVASLGASIDSLRISIVNSSVKTAYLRGLVLLPIADSAKANALDYKALFQTGDGFTFTLTPKGPFTSSFFAGGSFTLAQSSYLKIEIKQKSSFDVKLNGEFGWANKTVGPIKNVDIGVKFQGMQLAWVQGGKLNYKIGTWGFASPQKSIGKFPVSIENVKYVEKTPQSGEAARGAINFEVAVNLSEKIAGRTKLEVVGAIEHPGGMRFKPKFVEARVDSIGLYVKTSAVTIDGFVKFYQDHPMYGNGFNGAIKATFTTMQMEISAAARFGTTSYQSSQPYRYWYVDAKVILPPPGIVFLPGYAFYGFGVGAWQRMNVTNMPKPNATQVANANSTSSAASSGATFTPDKNVGFGFKVTAIMGTSPDSKKFNADVTLGGQFSTSGGLINISILGELWMMAKIPERANAPVKGSISIDYNHPQRVFHLAAKVNINKDPITTPNGVNMVIHIEGKTGNWYVKLGEPSNRNTIKVLGINTESYFMFGKNISAPTGFSPAITNGLNSVGVFNLVPSATATTSAIAGNGFAAGVGVNYDTGDKNKHLFGRVKLAYRVGGGFEVNLSLLRYPDNAVCAGGASIIGLHKWYAQGSVAAYAIFKVGIRVVPKDKWCAICCNGCYWNLADIRLGAYLQGGFPKPTWLQGEAGGSFSFLGGLISGSFHADIDYGSKCTPSAPAEAGPTAQADDAAADQQNALVKTVYPKNNAASIEITDRARVIYGFTPNETFDVIESQGGATGATLNRTFQARYTVTLQKKVGGSFGSPMQIKTAANALGEYLVLLSGPIVASPKFGNMTISSGPAGNPKKSNDNTPAPMNMGPNLDSATTYKVTVVGTLYEKKNGSWVPAKKRNNQPVTETATAVFTTVTPPPPPRAVNPSKNKMIKM